MSKDTFVHDYCNDKWYGPFPIKEALAKIEELRKKDEHLGCRTVPAWIKDSYLKDLELEKKEKK